MLYDLFLVLIGIVLGMIVKDPLKNLVTGKYKEDARQKKRVKLLLYIRGNKTKDHPTTEEMAENVFSGKLDIRTVTKLLQEVEETGLIRGVTNRDQDEGKTKWIYQKQK
ncbi:hypothetical protein LGQ02_03750 [Bacillus shivajii]|uniref:hypothetical protein n=1 Tax=Bacillus shivajii TaxID=1983719 RepID=UPI001CF99B7D|nr:hypothetical protein [Bacillus shivajii]UCZ55231.1 hypothetical protein LGQ02_03750 [Bacillus shivajii]